MDVESAEGAAKQSRKWCFTINNPLDNALQQIIPHATYLIAGREIAPTTGTPHLQGYVYLKKSARRTGVAKFLPSAFITQARGTHIQNRNYCSKSGHFEEHGEFPDLEAVQKANGEKGREYWAQVIRSAREGTVEEEFPEEFVKRHSFCVTMAKENPRKLPELDGGFDNRWYYGEPGTGKSRLARDEFPDLFNKSINKWWDGYLDQETVLLDDFDKNHACLSHYVKIWSDRYPFPIEIKNSYGQARPKRIIVTSNYKPEEIWPEDSVLVAAIYRRFRVERIGAPPIHVYFTDANGVRTKV